MAHGDFVVEIRFEFKYRISYDIDSLALSFWYVVMWMEEKQDWSGGGQIGWENRV